MPAQRRTPFEAVAIAADPELSQLLRSGLRALVGEVPDYRRRRAALATS